MGLRVCYVKGRDRERDSVCGCVCKLCERKREKDRLCVSVGYCES